VNVTALFTGFISTWRSRPGSPRTAAGTSSFDPERQFELLFLCRFRHQMDRGLEHGPQIEVDLLQFELALGDLREVQYVVDSVEQDIAARAFRALLRRQFAAELQAPAAHKLLFDPVPDYSVRYLNYSTNSEIPWLLDNVYIFSELKD
jgi:hypothetical protein